MVRLIQRQQKQRERHWTPERKRTFVVGIRRAASHVEVGVVAGVAILKPRGHRERGATSHFGTIGTRRRRARGR